jgi:ABC-type branched-subunit amino acid transport system substrate-binding protein
MLRTSLQLATLSRLLVLLSLCGVLPVRAAEHPDRVVIGINIPTTGPYAIQGLDEKRGYDLAIKRLNAGGGVLGKRLEAVIKDTASKPEVARANALEMIKKEGAVMLSGGVSSAVALAVSDVAQENRIPFLCGITHSNAVTGHERSAAGWVSQKAHRYTFRWFLNAWMTTYTLGPYLNRELGAKRDYFYITSDYTWGHSLEESLRHMTESKGAYTLGAVRTPLGKADFQDELQQALRAKPEVLVLVLYGNDMVTALKQAKSLGVKDKFQIVLPLVELNMVRQAGPEAMEGVIATTNWTWQLQERYPGTKGFVEVYQKEYGMMPGEGAAVAWVAVNQWAAAVQRAGTFGGAAVVRALEGHDFTLLKDRELWRDWDHQAVSSVFVVKGKSKAQSRGEWDLLEILEEVPGAKVMPTREENPVVLEPLE